MAIRTNKKNLKYSKIFFSRDSLGSFDDKLYKRRRMLNTFCRLYYSERTVYGLQKKLYFSAVEETSHTLLVTAYRILSTIIQIIQYYKHNSQSGELYIMFVCVSERSRLR